MDHPFNFPDDEPGEFLLEGVSAVGEIKSTLDGAALEDCIAKVAQFKSLQPIFHENDQLLNPSDYMSSTNGIPPFIVIALNSKLKKETLHRRLSAAPLVEPSAIVAQDGGQPQPPIDAVCVLGKYILWNLRHADGPISITTPRGPLRGWVAADTNAPLAWTIGWLHMMMPRFFRRESIFEWYFMGMRTGTRPSSPHIPPT